MYYVYILQLKNGDLYKGSTSDLNQRVLAHKNGKVDSTKNKNPKLIHYECYLKKSDAVRREMFLKTTEGKRLLRQQIRDVLSPRSPMDRTPASEVGDTGSIPVEDTN